MTEGVFHASIDELLQSRIEILARTLISPIEKFCKIEFGMTLTEWWVLATIVQSPRRTATTIAKKALINKVAVSRAVSKHVENGFIINAANEEDRRRSELSATGNGLRIYELGAKLLMSIESNLELITAEKGSDNVLKIFDIIDSNARSIEFHRARSSPSIAKLNSVIELPQDLARTSEATPGCRPFVRDAPLPVRKSIT